MEILWVWQWQYGAKVKRMPFDLHLDSSHFRKLHAEEWSIYWIGLPPCFSWRPCCSEAYVSGHTAIRDQVEVLSASWCQTSGCLWSVLLPETTWRPRVYAPTSWEWQESYAWSFVNNCRHGIERHMEGLCDIPHLHSNPQLKRSDSQKSPSRRTKENHRWLIPEDGCWWVWRWKKTRLPLDAWPLGV